MSESVLVVQTVERLREILLPHERRGARIGFVPTMGALHEGHLSLVRASVAECDISVVSLFVNPTQFGPGEDYDRYPKDFDGDREKLESLGADLVFHPDVAKMYPPGACTFVEVEGLSDLLCGASRSGHFRGVTTVVWKLLQMVDPTVAYFGAKDAQQVVVIRRMVLDLLGNWEIRSLPTVREEDGLAMSSRNRYLSPEERAVAPALYQALLTGEKALQGGERETKKVIQAAEEVLKGEERFQLEYLSLVSLGDLKPGKEAAGDLLFAGAARLGGARLIDNLCLRVGKKVERILP